MVTDRKRKYDLLMRKRDEFIRDNIVQKKERKEKEEKERLERKEERISFFPCTQGE
jgi:hypothetical protein